MTVQQMRDAIVDVYDTRSWKQKVANMYDDQVIAIYYNFSKRGVLNKVLRKERPEVKYSESSSKQSDQLSMFDFI